MNKLDLQLVKVIDKHIHADHVTGASKLRDEKNCSATSIIANIWVCTNI